MVTKQHTGRAGEETAVKYLMGKGYVIRGRNWRDRHREIDIIAEREGRLVVVEVKTRTAASTVDPRDSVNRKKQKNLVRAAEAYLQEQELDLPVRFDIIIINFMDNQTRVEHIEDAFFPTL